MPGCQVAQSAQEWRLTYFDRAAHQRLPFDGLDDDVEEIRRRFLGQIVHFRDAAGEIFHRLARRAALQVLVRTVKSAKKTS